MKYEPEQDCPLMSPGRARLKFLRTLTPAQIKLLDAMWWNGWRMLPVRESVLTARRSRAGRRKR